MNASGLTSRLGLVLGICLLNILVLGSWAWFASDDLSLPAIATITLLAVALEAMLWRRLAGSRRTALAEGNRDRVSSLLGRAGEGRRQSIRDDSTGLYTRWYLETRLEQEAERCRRYDQTMAVVVLRVGFVDLAEISTDGWQSPSAVAAQKCLQVVRTIDLSASLGPLEFAICLIHCDRAGAEHALQRLVSQLSDYKCDAGIAVYPTDGCEPDALIEVARMRSREAVSSA